MISIRTSSNSYIAFMFSILVVVLVGIDMVNHKVLLADVIFQSAIAPLPKLLDHDRAEAVVGQQ